MKHVFVISGKKGVGKDTIGKLIKEKFTCPECEGAVFEHPSFSITCDNCGTEGNLAKTFSFATPFKNFCVEVLGIPHEWCFGDSAARANEIEVDWNEIAPELRLNRTGKLTVRDALILIGQHMRKMYSNIWANAARVEARKFFSSNENNRAFILTDTRQPNEIDAFKKAPEALSGEWKITTIRVWRVVPLDGNSNDYTETALDHLDFVPTQQGIHQVKLLPSHMEVLDVGLLYKNPECHFADSSDYYIDNNISRDKLEDSVTRILYHTGAIE